MDYRQNIINRVFSCQSENGFWKVLKETDKYYPDYVHYVPNFKASLWALILLADLECDKDEPRVKIALNAIKEQFYNSKHGIYCLKKDHFPIPCLNGNILYLDCYFNGAPSEKSLNALEFFHKYQRFDDGEYICEKNQFCSNKSCYGKHSCYWGLVKLLKGISFIQDEHRSKEIIDLRDRCIEFILLHKVCFSSRKSDRIMIQKMDRLSFPNMYKGDFLEILWLLKREDVQSDHLSPALELLKSKRQEDGSWHLEKKVNNMVTSIGPLNKSNQFITERANEVLEYYKNL